jgi:putative intracellular protease/amidase
MNTAYVFVHDGFADWEPASALAELRRSFGFSVESMALTTQPVISMGGLKVLPDLRLTDFKPECAAILILPGGDFWTAGEIPAISKVVQSMAALALPVAAICGATLAIAHCGLLDDHLHTSNGKDFIGRYVPSYCGQQFYRSVPAVADRSIITANGLAPFPFAAEIFRTLAPQRKDDIEMYEKLYSRGLLD